MMLGRFLLPLLSCLSFAAAAQSGGSTQIAYAAGKVDLVEGDVRIYDKAMKARTVKVGDGVNESESIVTGADGELHMQMADGGYIAVRPNTKMRIAIFRAEGDENDKGVFGLLVGSFRSITGWIGKHSPRNYQVNTPTATIGVRGTDHEPLVIPEGSKEGEAGTYDKVNAGGSFIQTPHGRVEVAEHRAAFAAHAGTVAPRLLDSVPNFFRPTRNEQVLEHRHEAIQRTLDKRRNERRQSVAHRPGNRPDLRQERQAAKEARVQKQEANRQEKRQQQAQQRQKKQQEEAQQRQEKRQRGNPHHRD
jgi:hypothetical protein